MLLQTGIFPDSVRDIKAGEQFFFSYCFDGALAESHSDEPNLRSMASYANASAATPETEELRSTFRIQIAFS
jgi:hypothetical protein